MVRDSHRVAKRGPVVIPRPRKDSPLERAAMRFWRARASDKVDATEYKKSRWLLFRECARHDKKGKAK